MRWLIGALVALTIGLEVAPVAAAHPCSPEPVCHEFDWAIPYYDAFDRHGITYLGVEVGIPLMDQAYEICNGGTSREDIQTVDTYWSGGRRLTNAEVDKVIEAAYDVCPEAAK